MGLIEEEITFTYYHGESIFFKAHGVLWMGIVVKDYGESLLVNMRCPLNVGLGMIETNRVWRA